VSPQNDLANIKGKGERRKSFVKVTDGEHMDCLKKSRGVSVR